MHKQGADRELMLRGKPLELPMLQVQMLAPPIVQQAGGQAGAGGLLEYGQMLARRKWLILLITFGCALTGWLISLLQTPMYQARTALEVQGPNDNFLNLKELDPSVSEGQSSMEGYVETQAKILQDEALLEKTLAKLNLDHKPTRSGGRRRI